jgi:hypothetical protein
LEYVIMTAKTIGTMTDASMVSHAAMAVASGNTSSLRGILAGAVLIQIKPDESKAVRGLLETGFGQALAGAGNKVLDRHVATAKNYASRCFAAANELNWKWGAIDQAQELDAWLDANMVAFVAYFGTVSNIKAKGPDAKAAPRDKKPETGTTGPQEAPQGEPQPERPAELADIVDDIMQRLNAVGENGEFLVPDEMLMLLQDATQDAIKARIAMLEVPQQQAA